MSTIAEIQPICGEPGTILRAPLIAMEEEAAAASAQPWTVPVQQGCHSTLCVTVKPLVVTHCFGTKYLLNLDPLRQKVDKLQEISVPALDICPSCAPHHHHHHHHHYRNDAGYARCPPTILRGNLRPAGELPRDRSTPHAMSSTFTPPIMPTPSPNRQSTNYPSGEEPTNPRLLAPDYVHLLRDPHTHQHPCLQAATLGRAPPLLRLRVLPRYPRARECARDHSALAGEGLHKSLLG